MRIILIEYNLCRVNEVEMLDVAPAANENDDDFAAMDVVKLLKHWGLGQYVEVLVVDEGFEEMDDLKNLTLSDLQKYGFKEGHSKKFIRKVKAYFDANEGPKEGAGAEEGNATGSPPSVDPNKI